MNGRKRRNKGALMDKGDVLKDYFEKLKQSTNGAEDMKKIDEYLCVLNDKAKDLNPIQKNKIHEFITGVHPIENAEDFKNKTDEFLSCNNDLKEVFSSAWDDFSKDTE
jgi:hypothetical protein